MRKIDDSAQLILIAGFAIGLGIVVTTIMLNNIIYASNMASESTINTNNFDISNAVQMTSEAYKGAYTEATRGQPFNGAVFNHYIINYTDKASRMYALSGVSFTLVNGTFYDAYFTENGQYDGNSDWVVMNNISVTDYFLMIPNSSSLGNEEDAFEVQAINQSDVSIWSLKLYNDSGNIGFNVTNLTGSISGTAGYSLNITGNLIDVGTDFNFFFDTDTAGETYKLDFVDGSNAIGFFSVSGSLTDSQQFTRIRYKMTNASISMASSDSQINLSLPMCVP
ncbi:MAG: hypothetical protein E4G94_03855 [ANME-2 cluster archaeon]|nr:MAG: hypothetical protein E4G94_03855 [ANME-2 cluster archaeon]